MLVRQHQTKPPSLSIQQPFFYNDPQSIPAAYHPLTSVYHLTVERQHYLQDQQTRKPVSLTRKSSVDSVLSLGVLSSTPGSQVSLTEDSSPQRKITYIPLGHMVRHPKTLGQASTDYLSRIQRWLCSSTSQHHLNESSQHPASPLTVTHADDEPATSLIRKLSFVALRRGSSNNKSSTNSSGSSLKQSVTPTTTPLEKPLPPLPQRSSSATNLHHLSAKLGALLHRSTSFNKHRV